VMAERQPFTVGLERELLDLQSVSEPELDASALGVLLGALRAEPTPFTKPILETAPLNAEQREAVRSALSRPFTAPASAIMCLKAGRLAAQAKTDQRSRLSYGAGTGQWISRRCCEGGSVNDLYIWPQK
jgi:hypothetical protein